MKTRSRWFHLRRLFLLSGGCALGAIMCASALAGPVVYRESAARPHKAQNMPAQKKYEIYILSSTSAVPRPISYIIGGTLTTPTPLIIIGRGPTLAQGY
jgi:hypothetical protein